MFNITLQIYDPHICNHGVRYRVHVTSLDYNGVNIQVLYNQKNFQVTDAFRIFRVFKPICQCVHLKKRKSHKYCLVLNHQIKISNSKSSISNPKDFYYLKTTFCCKIQHHRGMAQPNYKNHDFFPIKFAI